jgi:hypothetical protein
MRRNERFVLLCVFATAGLFRPHRLAAQERAAEEIEALRQELQTLRESYEARIAELESRLTALEVTPRPPPRSRALPYPRVRAGAGGPRVHCLFTAERLPFQGVQPGHSRHRRLSGSGQPQPREPQSRPRDARERSVVQAILDPTRAPTSSWPSARRALTSKGLRPVSRRTGGLLLKAGKMRSAFGKVNRAAQPRPPGPIGAGHRESGGW